MMRHPENGKRIAFAVLYGLYTCTTLTMFVHFDLCTFVQWSVCSSYRAVHLASWLPCDGGFTDNDNDALRVFGTDPKIWCIKGS